MLLILADIILVIHFCIVIFLITGFFIVPIGSFFNWQWVRNNTLRLIHLSLIFFVTVETFLGFICPLTVIENYLRNIITSDSFIHYWIHRIIYWDFPTSFFLTLYFICLIWTLIMWKIYPPNKV